jgi:hypothetical protein
MIRAHYYGTAERVTVKAIGRKWITASDGRRYDLATLTDEGGGYSLRTPEEHAEEQGARGFACCCATWSGL